MLNIKTRQTEISTFLIPILVTASFVIELVCTCQQLGTLYGGYYPFMFVYYETV